MFSYKILENAESDLLDIWFYIADDNPQAADRVLSSIHERCLLLANNSKLGTARPDIRPDLRCFVVGSYLLLYREAETGIEIVRVLHGARNINAIFGVDD